MPIINTVTSYSSLYHDLKKMGRDNFSYDGAIALMESLDDIGINIEYDPIAFCCEYAEYSASEYKLLAQEYSNTDCPQFEDFEDFEDFTYDLLEWLEQETYVIRFNGGIILQSF